MEQDSCTSYHSRVQPTKVTFLEEKLNIQKEEKSNIEEEEKPNIKEEEEELKLVPVEKSDKETKIKKKEKKKERRPTPYYYSDGGLCRDGF